MIQIIQEACRACGICERECPLGAISLENGKVVISGALSCVHAARSARMKIIIFKKGTNHCALFPSVQCLIRRDTVAPARDMLIRALFSGTAHG